MTDQELKDLIASFAVTHEKSVEAADRRFARLEKQFADTDAQLKRIEEMVGGIASSQGQVADTETQLKWIEEMIGGITKDPSEVAEEFFYHSLASRLQVADIKFDGVYRNLGGKVGGLQDEFDLILVNGDTLAMFEVKTKAHVSLVDTMLQRKIPNLRKVLPYFKEYKIYAGIASLVTYDELIEQAKKQGLFLLTQLGDHVEVVNEKVICF